MKVKEVEESLRRPAGDRLAAARQRHASQRKTGPAVPWVRSRTAGRSRNDDPAVGWPAVDFRQSDSGSHEAWPVEFRPAELAVKARQSICSGGRCHADKRLDAVGVRFTAALAESRQFVPWLEDGVIAMWEKIRIVFTIPELRKKILFTLGLLLVYRVGWWIPLPIIDQEAMAGVFVEEQHRPGQRCSAGGHLQRHAS